MVRNAKNFQAEMTLVDSSPLPVAQKPEVFFPFILHNRKNIRMLSLFVTLLMTSPIRMNYVRFNKKAFLPSLYKKTLLLKELNVISRVIKIPVYSLPGHRTMRLTESEVLGRL